MRAKLQKMNVIQCCFLKSFVDHFLNLRTDSIQICLLNKIGGRKSTQIEIVALNINFRNVVGVVGVFIFERTVDVECPAGGCQCS